MQFGNAFSCVMVPGEYCCDLLTGGASLKAESSARHYDFKYKTAREIFGADTYALGLANDAIGYIVPDNDLTMGDPANHYHEFIGLGQYVGDPENHYHEFVSLGRYTGSAINNGLFELKKDIERNCLYDLPRS